jgi:hypothetical protein
MIAPKPAVSESDHGRQFNSSNINWPPAWSPRVIPFLTLDVGNSGTRLPGAMRNADLVTAKSDVPTAPGRIDTEASRNSESTLVGNAINNNSPDTDASVALRRGSIGTGDDADQAKESSGVAGELWLDTVSLRNWFQAYLAGEIARSSRATSQPHATF